MDMPNENVLDREGLCGIKERQRATENNYIVCERNRERMEWNCLI
jgi:hypothetical protein